MLRLTDTVARPESCDQTGGVETPNASTCLTTCSRRAHVRAVVFVSNCFPNASPYCSSMLKRCQARLFLFVNIWPLCSWVLLMCLVKKTMLGTSQWNPILPGIHWQVCKSHATCHGSAFSSAFPWNASHLLSVAHFPDQFWDVGPCHLPKQISRWNCCCHVWFAVEIHSAYEAPPSSQRRA